MMQMRGVEWSFRSWMVGFRCVWDLATSDAHMGSRRRGREPSPSPSQTNRGNRCGAALCHRDRGGPLRAARVSVTAPPGADEERACRHVGQSSQSAYPLLPRGVRLTRRLPHHGGEGLLPRTVVGKVVAPRLVRTSTRWSCPGESSHWQKKRATALTTGASTRWPRSSKSSSGVEKSPSSVARSFRAGLCAAARRVEL